MPAIALTDKQNLFGAFEFSLEAQKNGVQPILGIDLELKKIDHLELPSHILLLIKHLKIMIKKLVIIIILELLILM